jgi:hypothetical protein
LHAAAFAAAVAAATSFAVSNLTQPVFDPPSKLPDVKYDWQVPYTPCSWNKQQQKAGSTSVDCARSGGVVLTGKYGLVFERPDGALAEAVPGLGGAMAEVEFSGVPYEGEGVDELLFDADGDQ